MPDKTQAVGDKCLCCGLPDARMDLCDEWLCPRLLLGKFPQACEPEKVSVAALAAQITERDRQLVRKMFGTSFSARMGALAEALAELSAAAREEGRSAARGQFGHNQGAVEEALRERHYSWDMDR